MIFNPLSQSNENPWNDFYQNNELKQTIRNDVDRTYQEQALFLKEETKEMMVKILFIWSKNNADISYRQGMNELLAVLIVAAFSEKAHEDLDGSIKEINDLTQVEADLYWMFTKLMDLGVKEMFLPVISSKKKNLNKLLSIGIANELVNDDKTNQADVSKILKRCHRAHHRLLQALDKQLYAYLESQKIEPQIYLQRWIRCILSREFNISDTLVLWDCILACANAKHENKIEEFTGKLDFSKELVMLDFLCVAMIVFVRNFRMVYLVLQSDATGIMRRLLKFPPVEDVRILINMAKSYKERILTGKGVTLPQIMNQIVEDPLRTKNETKFPTVLITTPTKTSPNFHERIDMIVNLLQEQNTV